MRGEFARTAASRPVLGVCVRVTVRGLWFGLGLRSMQGRHRDAAKLMIMKEDLLLWSIWHGGLFRQPMGPWAFSLVLKEQFQFSLNKGSWVLFHGSSFCPRG